MSSNYSFHAAWANAQQKAADEYKAELAKLDQVGNPITLTDPITGELVTMESPIETLGEYLVDVREYESLLRESKRIVNQEIAARIDAAVRAGESREFTIHSHGLKISVPSPEPATEYDADDLHAGLMELVDARALTIDAVNEVIETTVTLKVRRSPLNTLMKLDAQVREIAEKAKRLVPKERRAKVERA
jgi:hypothetical protein